MTRLLVSVLIDTYNHERFIEAALQSVLSQDFPAGEREILVVDDGSTDKTPEILAKFAGDVRILRKTNGGQASAFNHGIPQCRGELVAFLDGDDWWAPGKLARVAQAMAADPPVGIIGHGIINVHNDGTQVIDTLREGFRFQANTLEGALLFRRRCSFLGTSRLTIRANLLKQIGPVPENIRIQADEYLFTLASVLSAAQILSEPLTFYRHHEANLFQIASHSPEKLRNKQQSLALLASTLSRRLQELGIASDVHHAVIDYTRASADQLRLQLDGGWPWETITTEWDLYRITHPDASSSHRTFKFLSLLAAALLPPRAYYSLQRSLANNKAYLRMRQRFLPVPKMPHIERDRRAHP